MLGRDDSGQNSRVREIERNNTVKKWRHKLEECNDAEFQADAEVLNKDENFKGKALLGEVHVVD